MSLWFSSVDSTSSIVTIPVRSQTLEHWRHFSLVYLVLALGRVRSVMDAVWWAWIDPQKFPLLTYFKELRKIETSKNTMKSKNIERLSRVDIWQMCSAPQTLFYAAFHLPSCCCPDVQKIHTLIHYLSCSLSYSDRGGSSSSMSWIKLACRDGRECHCIWPWLSD